MRLALALGMRLPDVHDMPHDEFMLWKAYELTQGLPLTRLEATVAMSGAAQCQTWGAKVRPADLIPRFEPPRLLTYKEGAEIFAAMAHGHNQRIDGKRNR